MKERITVFSIDITIKILLRFFAFRLWFVSLWQQEYQIRFADGYNFQLGVQHFFRPSFNANENTWKI